MGMFVYVYNLSIYMYVCVRLGIRLVGWCTFNNNIIYRYAKSLLV